MGGEPAQRVRGHLDVGVGTGWFLDRVRPPADLELTLLDANPACLHHAAARLARSETARRIAGVSVILFGLYTLWQAF